MVTIIHEQREVEVSPIAVAGDALLVAASDLTQVTGFVVKPEGLCRDEICIPVPPAGPVFVDPTTGAVDIAAFWRHLGHPVVHDSAGTVFVLGIGTGERRRTLATREAPDFQLPDLDGRLSRLSDFRGRKVFLATWASW